MIASKWTMKGEAGFEIGCRQATPDRYLIGTTHDQEWCRSISYIKTSRTINTLKSCSLRLFTLDSPMSLPAQNSNCGH